MISMMSASPTNNITLSVSLKDQEAILTIAQTGSSCSAEFSPGSVLNETSVVEKNGEMYALMSVYNSTACDAENERKPSVKRYSLDSILATSSFQKAHHAVRSRDATVFVCIQVFKPGAMDGDLVCPDVDLSDVNESENVFYSSNFSTLSPQNNSSDTNTEGDPRYNLCADVVKKMAMKEAIAEFGRDLKIMAFKSTLSPVETVATWFNYEVAIGRSGRILKTWYAEGTGHRDVCDEATVSLLPRPFTFEPAHETSKPQRVQSAHCKSENSKFNVLIVREESSSTFRVELRSSERIFQVLENMPQVGRNEDEFLLTDIRNFDDRGDMEVTIGLRWEDDVVTGYFSEAANGGLSPLPGVSLHSCKVVLMP